MRFLGLIFIACGAAPLLAQDATQQIQQIQQQQMQQIQQQQIQQQQTQLINQQIIDQTVATSMSGLQYGARKPVFDVTPGTTSGTVILRMKDGSRGASIFYTTDGWTPSPASTRYEGPIEFDRTATVRAVAIAAGALRSTVAVQEIDVPGSRALSIPSELPAVRSLAPGTAVQLRFAAAVTSEGLSIGDKLPVVLAQDIVVGGETFARSGTAVLATVSLVDQRRRAGLSGAIAFSVRSLTMDNGDKLPLVGGELQEAEPRSRAILATAVVPLGPIFIKGKDARILQGATLTAHVAGVLQTKAN